MTKEESPVSYLVIASDDATVVEDFETLAEARRFLLTEVDDPNDYHVFDTEADPSDVSHNFYTLGDDGDLHFPSHPRH